MKSTDQKNTLTDQKIIELYFERNEDAIEATDKKYGNYLFTIGHNILSDKYESEACMNDTYFRTWNRIPPERPSIFQAFLSKIMRDVSIDTYRKRAADKRKISELSLSLEELGDCIVADSSIEEDYAIKRLGEILNVFLRDLSKRERFMFICRYYYCDSARYISNMLSVSVKTVYRELEKIRARLKEKLDEEGINV